MIYKGKYKIINNLITACDYDFVLSEIEKALTNKKKLLISPIASHTLVRAHYDKNLRKTLNKFDYLVPDSQWVRWSIPFLYGKDSGLKNRVYGPELMLKILKLSKNKNYKIFLYGNTGEVLKKLINKLIKDIPNLKIVGIEESKFRKLTNEEWHSLVKKIEISKADIIFISLGSPKQEIFSNELSVHLDKPLLIIPIGAAFDFISKNTPQAPIWIGNLGLEWLYRLIFEKNRLLKRYLFYGVVFLIMILKEYITLRTKRK